MEFKLSAKHEEFILTYIDSNGADVTYQTPSLGDIFNRIQREYKNILPICDMQYEPLCQYYRGKLFPCRYGQVHGVFCPYVHGESINNGGKRS